MRTRSFTDPTSGNIQFVTEFLLGDIEDLSRNEATFKAVMIKTVDVIASTIAAELTPKIKDYIISKIDVEQLVQDAAKKKVNDLLFGDK